MKLKEIYIAGVLECIGQENEMIGVRINSVRKVKVYDNNKVSEIPFKTKFADEFNKKELTLSHQIGCFAEGDKVKLSRFIGPTEDADRFVLQDLTLSTADVCGLDELTPKQPIKDLFSVEVIGTLERISPAKGNVALRIICSQKHFTFFKDGDNNKMYGKTETFKKTIIGVIKKDDLRYDLCIETSVLYKRGDRIRLSHAVEEGDSYDLDNLTLSLNYGNHTYTTKEDL